MPSTDVNTNAWDEGRGFLFFFTGCGGGFEGCGRDGEVEDTGEAKEGKEEDVADDGISICDFNGFNEVEEVDGEIDIVELESEIAEEEVEELEEIKEE